VNTKENTFFYIVIDNYLINIQINSLIYNFWSKRT